MVTCGIFANEHKTIEQYGDCININDDSESRLNGYRSVCITNEFDRS